MGIHMVRLPQAMREIQFEFIGSTKPAQQEMLIETINHFYQVTGSLYGRSDLPVVYSLYLDEKGGNNFQRRNQIHFNSRNLSEWTVTHELAHSLDSAHGWQLSKQMKEITGSGFLSKALHIAHPGWKVFWYRAGSPPPPCGIDKNFNSLEDFAESVTAYIYPEEAHRRAFARGYPYEKWGFKHFHATPRGIFISNLIKKENQTALS